MSFAPVKDDLNSLPYASCCFGADIPEWTLNFTGLLLDFLLKKLGDMTGIDLINPHLPNFRINKSSHSVYPLISMLRILPF